MSEKYIIITRGMVQDLKLRGSELLIYGLVSGFNQDGESDFHGSIGYIQEMTGLSRRAVSYSLQSLCDRGLIVKAQFTLGGIMYNSYKTVGNEACAKIAGGVQKLHGGCAKIAPNNIVYNNKEKIIEKRKEFGENLRPYKDKYPREMLVAFMNYWCEVDNDENPKFLKWEIAKKKGGTFSIGGRLTTWAKNNKITPVKKEERPIWEVMGITEEEYKSL